MSRWWTYQKERFPLSLNATLIFVFSLSAVSYSSLLRGNAELPSLAVTLVAFLSCLLFFFELRVADEFKDFEEDLKYRPYRPVPRGLVTRRELGILAGLSLVIQLALAWWLEPQLIFLLALVWAFWFFMSNEFFVSRWLKARPLLYLASHMLIMPLIDLYATACDWLVAGAAKPANGLAWFLLLSFFNGVVVEVGRKLRAPEDEEEGVETYTALFGIRRASILWLSAMLATSLVAILAAIEITILGPVALLLLILLASGVFLLQRFQTPKAGMGKTLELFSGIWTILIYLSVGILPLIWKVWQS